ncbi:MAG: peptide chain release factor N(5)-glutamine methyltransferase [Mariprofundaceae bacterium]|nr:peptide chain release factor N(5)-glutamine methyltransferase [Mariprofundaceae bacterium]
MPSSTIKETLQEAVTLLRKAGCESPRLDAEVLWMHVSGQSKTETIMAAYEAVPLKNKQLYMASIKRRCLREPVAYITGKKEFWSRSFMVNADVLIPRPETEHMIEWVLGHYPQQDHAWYFADVGTGSGCIAVTLACEYPKSRILACDISLAAIETARSNAIYHGVEDRIDFVVSDLLLGYAEPALFDAIISNPPYVSAEEMHQLPPDLAYEPKAALTDHGDGLQCMRKLLNQSILLLKNKGHLCVETGPCGYIKTPPPPITLQSTYRDLAGHLRGAVYCCRRVDQTGQMDILK